MNQRKFLLLLLRILFTAASVYWLVHHISLADIQSVLSQSSAVVLILSFLFFNLSKIFASVRLQWLLRSIEIKISFWSSVVLHYRASFFGMFLPGSISGDVYKVLSIKDVSNAQYKSLVGVLLLDRLGGLVANLLLCVLFAMFFVDAWIYVSCIAVVSIAALVIRYFFIAKMNTRLNFDIVSKSKLIPFSFGVQVCQLMSFLVLAVFAKTVELQFVCPFSFLFLLSSIASTLPISIGGLGIRELVLLHGGQWLNLGDSAVFFTSVGFAFTVIGILSNCIGVLPLQFLDKSEY